MKIVQLRWRPCLPALILTFLPLTALALGTAAAQTPAGAPTVAYSRAPQCDPSQLMHATTHEYRMFYDPNYAAAQRVRAATNEYRSFYDYSYASARRIAAATDGYCAGRR